MRNLPESLQRYLNITEKYQNITLTTAGEISPLARSIGLISSIYNTPQISCCATSSEFSDKSIYPFFSRMMTADSMRVFLSHYGEEDEEINFFFRANWLSLLSNTSTGSECVLPMSEIILSAQIWQKISLRLPLRKASSFSPLSHSWVSPMRTRTQMKFVLLSNS
jgi:hypothetical protein